MAGGRDGSGGPRELPEQLVSPSFPAPPPPPRFHQPPCFLSLASPKLLTSSIPLTCSAAARRWDRVLPPIWVFLGIVPTAHDFRNANGFACRFSGRCQGRRERQRGMLRFYQNQFSCPGEDGKQLLSLRKTILFKPQDHVVATSYLPEWKVTLRSYHLSCRRTD